MYFNNIVGQKFAKKYFINAINKNRLNHAYIFEGIEGVGKKLFADELCKILLDTNNLEYSPDYFFVSCDDKKSIKIENIRNLQKDIIVKPHKKYKIYVIEEAQNLTEQAQNALLKTLEEPPSYVLFILLTTNKESILPTIKSRCEIVKFSFVSDYDMINYLKSFTFDDEKIKLAVSFAKGSVKKALEFLKEDSYSKESFENLRSFSKEIIDVLFKKDLFEISCLVDEISKHKENIFEVLDVFCSYFVDCMVLAENINKDNIKNLDKLVFIKNINKKISYSQTTKIIDIIELTKKKLKSNCNFNITLSNMFFKIYEVIK